MPRQRRHQRSKTVCSGTGACASVSDDHSYYWMNNAQKFAPGPESGAPPDNSGSWYPAH